ncbi:ATP synthase subunit C [Eubacteriales bacterium OttesenSCG-928-G02]|nr:ATP synthase subunit C [Eubacteriales bacterium OttesenSCG-928-G02]
MNNIILPFILIIPIFAIGFLAYHTFKKRASGANIKKTMALNLVVFILIVIVASLLVFNVTAEEPNVNTATQENSGSEQSAEPVSDNSKGLGLIAAGLVTGLAGIGGGIAVAAGAPAAIAATSEDPKVFGKALIFVALGETIALYGVVISILILNKI